MNVDDVEEVHDLREVIVVEVWLIRMINKINDLQVIVMPESSILYDVC